MRSVLTPGRRAITCLMVLAAIAGCDKLKQDGNVPSSEYRGGPLDAVRAANASDEAPAASSAPAAAGTGTKK